MIYILRIIYKDMKDIESRVIAIRERKNLRSDFISFIASTTIRTCIKTRRLLLLEIGPFNAGHCTPNCLNL